MMTISDYASLLVDVGEYSERDDIAHLFPRFLGLAEAKMNRVLRVGEMETTAVVSLVEGDGPLPDDFLEARMVTVANGRGLSSWSLQELNRRFRNYGGVPAGYAIVGSTIKARPSTTGNVVLDYYAKIPLLTPQNPTNWLLDKAPDAYLYALVEEVGIWSKNVDLVTSARGLKEAALYGLTLQDEGARWGNGQVVIGGPTP